MPNLTLRKRVSLTFEPIKDSDGVVLNLEVLSKTDQSFAKEADINFIMRRFEQTGFLVDPILAARAKQRPLFGDFVDVPDYQEILGRIARFREHFDRLPVSTKLKFENDPERLINFLADPVNDAEAIDLGLKPKKPVEEPVGGSAPAPLVPSPVPPVVPAV